MNRSLFIFDEKDDSEWTKTDRNNQPVIDFSFDEPATTSTSNDYFEDTPKKDDTSPRCIYESKVVTLPPTSEPTKERSVEPGRSSPTTSVASSSSNHNFTVLNAAPGASSTDYDRLMKQHAKLKTAYEHLRGERFRTLPVKESINRLMHGRSANLYAYRSRYDKEQLLYEATKLGDGDIILTIILYLKSTLHESIFRQMIQSNMSVLNHYIAYVKEMCTINEANQILSSFGRHEEATALEFENCLVKQDPQARLNSINRLINSNVVSGGLDSLRYQDYYCQYANLLQRQIVIDKHDDEQQFNGHPKFTRYPKEKSLIGQSPIMTLLYSALYHFDAPEPDQTSPLAIRNAHHFTDAQYNFTLMKSLARQERWPDVDNLMQKKSMIGLLKVKMPLNAEIVVEMLSQYNAPSDLIAKYLMQMGNVEERLQTAKKVQCHQAVVDCYVALKDRQALLQFMMSLQPKTVPYIYAEKAMNNSSIKWKN